MLQLRVLPAQEGWRPPSLRPSLPSPPPPPEFPFTPIENIVADAVAVMLLEEEEILALPRHQKRHSLGTTMVYFLIRKEKVVYVGLALEAKARHSGRDAYNFHYDSWAGIRCEPTQRYVLEQRYIEYLQPPENQMGKDGNSAFSLSRLPLYLPDSRSPRPVLSQKYPENPFAPAPRVPDWERSRYAMTQAITPNDSMREFRDCLTWFLGTVADNSRCEMTQWVSGKPIVLEFKIGGIRYSVSLNSEELSYFTWPNKPVEGSVPDFGAVLRAARLRRAENKIF